MTKYVVLDWTVIWGVGITKEEAIQDAKHWLGDPRDFEYREDYYCPAGGSMHLLECSDMLYDAVTLIGTEADYEIREKSNRNGHFVVLANVEEMDSR